MSALKHGPLGLAALCLAGVFSAQSAHAGSCNDPWVTQAVTNALRRPPSGPAAPECNIMLYYGHNRAGQMQAGQWNSYLDLQAGVGAYWGTHSYPTTPVAAPPGPLVTPSPANGCRDPWVNQLTTKYLHHAPSSPNAPQCDNSLYRNGHWANFADLDAAVDAHWAVNPDPDRPGASGGGFAYSSQSLFTPGQAQALPTGTLNGQTVYLYSGSWYALVSAGGGNWTTRLVSAGGGNLLSTASGSIVSAGGGNIVSAGGGNLIRLQGQINIDRYNSAMRR